MSQSPHGHLVRHMKAHFTIVALAVAIGVARAADKPVDLTGAEESKFKANLGQTVILRGLLYVEGKQGPCLFGATPTNVVFYIIPEITKSAYSYPFAWTRLEHQQVRITGELKFCSFDHSKGGPTDQVPPDYYYMVLQHTKIERDKPK